MIRLKNVFKILIITGCALLFSACPEDAPQFLYLENNSNDTLGVYTANGFHTAYPDTLLPFNYKDGLLRGGIEGTMTGSIYTFRGSLEESFKRLPKDTLSIFILNMNNVLNTYINMDSIWQEMNYGERFLWRYDLSIQDIKKLNFLLPYPPDERMKDMKMYPPYGNE